MKKKKQQIGPQHFPVDFLGDLKQVMMIDPIRSYENAANQIAADQRHNRHQICPFVSFRQINQ